jgi:hypothetical protein
VRRLAWSIASWTFTSERAAVSIFEGEEGAGRGGEGGRRGVGERDGMGGGEREREEEGGKAGDALN